MRKLLFALVLAGAVAACAEYQNPLTPPTLAEVEAGYGAAEAIAVGYRDACDKRLIPNSCRLIVPKIQRAGGQAQVAILEARQFTKDHPTINATAAVVIAQDAVAAFKALVPAIDANGNKVK